MKPRTTLYATLAILFLILLALSATRSAKPQPRHPPSDVTPIPMH